MKDKKSNQLSETSFRDNVAHSNGDLGLTSRFLYVLKESVVPLYQALTLHLISTVHSLPTWLDSGEWWHFAQHEVV